MGTISNSAKASNDLQRYSTIFRKFLKEYYVGNYFYKYRQMITDNHLLEEYFLTIDFDELEAWDSDLSDFLSRNTHSMDAFEDTLTQVADELTTPRASGSEDVPKFQILIYPSGLAVPSFTMEKIGARSISKLLLVSGIIVRISPVLIKAVKMALICSHCGDSIDHITIKKGLNGYLLPKKCQRKSTDKEDRESNSCGQNSYQIDPERCEVVDMQILRLQQLPEEKLMSTTPRHLKLYCDRYLCDRLVPGNRVTVCGVFSIIGVSKQCRNISIETGLAGSYLHVFGYKIDRNPISTISRGLNSDNKNFGDLLKGYSYEKICASIAPAIFGLDDVKKAIATMLFSGSTKYLPDGTRRRGDINILLLGDPGTAKSQILKFVEQVAPIGVYTSGRGSSACGLTASVIRDSSTRGFSVEGGAMILADGGIVCIDEFDKMREDDRVAIHEAMEQQTISIAKAGINITLNSRCGVLAAANPTHSSWNHDQSDAENINFMPTILSRFDMIFIIKEKYNFEADKAKARHVISTHSSEFIDNSQLTGELSVDTLRGYIAHCRSTIGPRLSKEAQEILSEKYVKFRNDRVNKKRGKQSPIRITIRQLEAMIRISESLAKMEQSPFATGKHVREAIRLFEVSTFEAAKATATERKILQDSEYT